MTHFIFRNLIFAKQWKENNVKNYNLHIVFTAGYVMKNNYTELLSVYNGLRCV